jgi:hypothetical protein
MKTVLKSGAGFGACPEKLDKRGAGFVSWPPLAAHAELAQLVERNLAKVEVAGSSPVFRSTRRPSDRPTRGLEAFVVCAALQRRCALPGPCHSRTGVGACRSVERKATRRGYAVSAFAPLAACLLNSSSAPAHLENDIADTQPAPWEMRAKVDHLATCGGERCRADSFEGQVHARSGGLDLDMTDRDEYL